MSSLPSQITASAHGERSNVIDALVETTPLLLGSAVAAILVMWLDFRAFTGDRPFFPPQDARFRMWLLVYGIQATIWVASLRLTAPAIIELWRSQTWEQRRAALATTLGAAILALPVVLARPDDVMRAMKLTTIPQQQEKFWVLLIPLGAASIAALGIALHRGGAAGLEAIADEGERLRAIIGAQLEANTWLKWVGLIIGGATLGSGILRRALLSRPGASEQMFPVDEVIGYGLAFSLLLATVYLPTAAALAGQAQRARDVILEADQKLQGAAWLKARKDLDELLGTTIDVQKSIPAGIGILGPLIGALLAQALPK